MPVAAVTSRGSPRVSSASSIAQSASAAALLTPRFLASADGDHGHRGRLRAGAGGGRHQRQRQPACRPPCRRPRSCRDRRRCRSDRRRAWRHPSGCRRRSRRRRPPLAGRDRGHQGRRATDRARPRRTGSARCRLPSSPRSASAQAERADPGVGNEQAAAGRQQPRPGAAPMPGPAISLGP